MAQRDLYIDRLRSVMTAMVLLHHTAITYGASGSWFYNELHASGTVVCVACWLVADPLVRLPGVRRVV